MRAESAAKGETKAGRETAIGSVRRVSPEAGTMDGRVEFLAEASGVTLAPGLGCTEPISLSSCSMGNRRCACDIFQQAEFEMKALLLLITQFARECAA